ncbi:MAG: hypothetical protein ACLFN1_03505 [Bacteroidales bacterium]
MMRRKTVFIVLLSFLLLSSCVKETYDMDMLSGEAALNPGLVMSAVKGEVTLSDIVEPNDTLVFDNELLKLVFREDSVINFGLDEFYTSFPGETYENTIPVVSNSIPTVHDTLDIEPGGDIKLSNMKVSGGQISYSFTSWASFDTRIHFSAPGVDMGGTELDVTIDIPADAVTTGVIDLDNALVDFGTDQNQPYNRLPLEYEIRVPEEPASYDLSDSVRINVEFEEPDFDYLTGYFGQYTEEMSRDTMDLGMEDLFSRLSGSIHISDPSITVNYLNSFGMPMRVNTEVKGMNDEEEIALERDPVDLDYPTDTDNRDISSSFVIDRDNSSLPELISMLPREIEFYGSAAVNPDEETLDNIIFGDSRFTAGIEVEVPMEFRIASLQLSDTVDNFMAADPGEDDPLQDLEELEFSLYMENGFPLNVAVMIELYDSTSMTVLETIDTGELFTAAPVDADGRVTEPGIGTTDIEFPRSFLDAAQEADNIIFTFTLNTTDNGTKDVRIYSDYSILFKAAVRMKAGLKFNFNSEDQ